MSGKKYQAAKEKLEQREYTLEEAVQSIRELKFAKFDETAELALRLGVDPRHADQMVRGTVVLPNGLGKEVRVCVIVSADKVKEAEEAGAEHIGGDDLVEKIQGGWLDFDVVVSTPDMMKGVGKLGRVLGPRGLMPNPKAGTVTFDVGKAVTEIKAGKVEFRVDKNGVIHAPFGKLSFSGDQLVENAQSLIDAVIRAKPASSKGRYLRGVFVSSTMGPGIRVNVAQVEAK
ncbi:MAG: 50S ribosomal protein L1 [Acidobacteria bacterium]|jgi:large subunit ribosomal protein L1|nr:50S ribosomal protein L1 [Acidobacteriota bacterium]